MTNRECLVGWVLAPSPTDGTNVPFFIQVRDKDIVWDEKTLPQDLKQLSEIGDSKEVYFTGAYWKIDYRGWRIKLNIDGTYNAKKKINIGESFDDITTNSASIVATIALPFRTLNDGDFFISMTNISDDLRIKSATNGIKEIRDEAFESIQIYLQNTQYFFSSNFKLNSLYTDSYMYINIDGKIKI